MTILYLAWSPTLFKWHGNNFRASGYYLFPRNISDYESLQKEMPRIMYEQGYERYRHDLGFRTPNETFHGVDIGIRKIENNFIIATQKRKTDNKRFPCEQYC